MRILLVQPEGQVSRIGFRLAAMPEPLALEMLAATVPDHEVRILDMRIDAELRSELESFSPDLVGVTALTTEVYSAQDVARSVKQFSSEIFTLAGGHHASLIPEDFCIPQVNAIARGEGELAFPKLVDAVSNQRDLHSVANLIWQDRDGRFVHNPTDETALDMDDLSLPRRDLSEKYREHYFWLFERPDTSLATGRGCPYRCNFCSVWVFNGGKTRQMSPQRVVDQVAAATTDHITFVDDNFLMNHRREHTIADLIKDSGLRKRFSMECRTDSIVRHPDLVEKWADIGLHSVLLGLEGASDKTLKDVNKRTTTATNDGAIRILHDNGVMIWGAFLVDPNWEKDDFARLRDYVTKNEITHTQFTVLTPLPGTELYRQKFDELLTRNYGCYDLMHAVTPTRLPREEFYKQFAGLYRQQNTNIYYELVRDGKLSIDDVRRGKRIYDELSNWEFYLANDPVLGKCA